MIHYKALLTEGLQASLFERDSKKSFFGSHYNKLKSIKNKYDPTTLFVVAEGVDRKSTRLNSSHSGESRMPSSA